MSKYGQATAFFPSWPLVRWRDEDQVRDVPILLGGPTTAYQQLQGGEEKLECCLSQEKATQALPLH